MIGKHEMMAQRKAGPSCLGPASLLWYQSSVSLRESQNTGIRGESALAFLVSEPLEFLLQRFPVDSVGLPLVDFF
jgi:hypothetical protein